MSLQAQTPLRIEVHLPDVIGRGYGTFWKFRGRYRAVIGSRSSKKSKTIALWLIYHMMRWPLANALVVRKFFYTLRTSCFVELQWATERLKVQHLWKVTESPLEMTYLPTGQKIYFRGLDDPLKITSITVKKGTLCWGWLEEAYEVLFENDFNILDESFRGILPPGYWRQWTLTLNPWNEKHWINKRFFKEKEKKEGEPEAENEGIKSLAMQVNYLCNEFLDPSDLALFEHMRIHNPKRYRVAGLGNWGIVEGLVYDRWKEVAFDIEDVKKLPGVRPVFGLDFGYTHDPSALFCGFINPKTKEMWVFDEVYQRGLSNEAIFEIIEKKGYRKENIRADSAEPKSIDRLRGLGMYNIRPARKGRDSVLFGIDFLQEFKMYVHPDKCPNFLAEIGAYVWDEDKHGRKLNVPIDGFNHLMDAMRYAVEDYSRPVTFSFN